MACCSGEKDYMKLALFGRINPWRGPACLKKKCHHIGIKGRRSRPLRDLNKSTTAAAASLIYYLIDIILIFASFPTIIIILDIQKRPVLTASLQKVMHRFIFITIRYLVQFF